MAMEVTDEMLRKLTQEWVNSIPAQYPEPEHPHHFSLRFHLRMLPLFWRAWRMENEKEKTPLPMRGGRMAAALLAAAVMSATVAMAVPEIREKVFQMVREIYEKYSNIHYEQLDESYVAGEFVQYRLTYIPEGFVQTQDQNVGESHFEKYKNADGLTIKFSQLRLEKAVFDIDTENVEPVEISLNNNQIAWYVGNNSWKVLYWDNGEYSFIVGSHLTKEELVKIANSVSSL